MRAPTISVVVGILLRGRSALVARRPEGSHLAGTWEFPGGKVHPNESLEDALKREMMEEIGVSFDGAELFDRVDHDYGDRLVSLTFFLCSGPRGAAMALEGQELRWVDEEELKLLPTPKANERVIERLRNHLTVDADPAPRRESEIKIALDGREAFLRVLHAPEFGSVLGVSTLENHYFDTADRTLRGRRVMLRLRRSSSWVACLKIGAETRPGYFQSLEFETEVAPENALRILEDPTAMLDCAGLVSNELRHRFGRLDLGHVGCLTTERTRRGGEGAPESIDGIEVEMDRLIFPDNKEAYELEVETSQATEVEGWVYSVLRQLHVEARSQRKTKLEQFLEWHDRMR